MDYSPEYYRELKHLFQKDFIEEMFQRNSIPVNYYQMDKSISESKMDSVYLDESDPYIVELQGGTKELDGEKYFGRDYTLVENVYCVFTVEKTREENLSRFGLEVTERVDAVFFLASQIEPLEGDYVQVPLFQEGEESLKQDDGRVLPSDQMYILYRILHAKPDETGMIFNTILQRVDKPTDVENLIS